MAKRFIDTEIWKKQRWFRRLSPHHKLAFLYIVCECDHAGVWKINCPDLIDELGLENGFNLHDFIKCCNIDYDIISGEPIEKQRIMYLEKQGILFITKYCQFQYEGKKRMVNAYGSLARSGIEKLADYELLYFSISNNFLTLEQDVGPLSTGCIHPVDRVKEKEKEILGRLYTQGSGDRREGVGGKEGANGVSPPKRNGAHLPPPVVSVGGLVCRPKKLKNGSYAYTEIRGQRFSEDFTKVLLMDESWQELDTSQVALASKSQLKPNEVYKIVVN